jgi:23S rRNA (uracil1939-C5)-methyltransferase
VLTPKEGSAVSFGHPVLKTTAPLRPEVPLYFRPDGFAQANEAANAELVRAAMVLTAGIDGRSDERRPAGVISAPIGNGGAAAVDGTGTAASAPVGGDRASSQDEAALTGRVLELYSGNGNFTFALAARAREVLAVESGAVSVELARRSAREATLSNVRFIQGDTRKVVDGLVKEGQRFEVLFLDPPRTGAKGCDQWARALEVSRVVYVACDPAALARDAKALKAAGFRPEALRIVDMFPQTRHVEAVLSFSRS